uniref:Vacuolar protein sorting-associated protein 11 homolog n=1 Tax=Rhipicephalus pulchellus TaxID=72859 RepID=L7M659_RHIPC
MAFKQWRRFNFFDKEVVRDGDKAFDKLQELSVTCSASGRGQLVLGEVGGHVVCVSRQLQLTTFRAYELTVELMQQMRNHALLVTLGADESGVNPLVKVWNQDKVDKHGVPHCCRIVRAAAGTSPSPAKSLAVDERLTLMAVGLEDGRLLLYRGDVTRQQSRQTVVPLESGSVNALAFGGANQLFVVTATKVLSLVLGAHGQPSKQLVLDAHGCAPQCAALSIEGEFVVARQDAVYFYHPEGRGSCFVFEDEKLLLRWFRTYLVLVARDAKTSRSAGGPDKTIVTIYDIQNKFVAYSAAIPGVVDVMAEWGSLYVLVQEGKLYCLRERDTQSKLELLFRKNQYSLAISLARSQKYDQDGLADIFRQYGDHLYSKGDYEGAVQQYIRTVGKLEASYVIRKFLDAQRIGNLTEYLQELHRRGFANEDHTTLLLNCYTKLEEDDKLTSFIMTEDVAFDVEIAVRVCRQAGYFAQARHLAKKHGCHDLYLHIQLDDCKDYADALQYISQLDHAQAEGYMQKYGKALLDAIPAETTQLLMQLCNDRSGSSLHRSHPEDFIHIFVNNSEELLRFLEHMVNVQPDSSSLVYNTLLELHLQAYKHEENPEARQAREQHIMEMLRNMQSRYDLDQALVLCQMNGFKPGILHLYEKAKLYHQILAYHIDQHDYDGVIKLCEKFGIYDPNLWIQALGFFARAEGASQHLATVLQQVEKGRLLPPVLVVEMTRPAPLSSLRDYLVRHLQAESRQLDEHQRLITQYRQETERVRQEMNDLRNGPRIFQDAKCSGCNHQLELPSVHFLCGHSYHQQCFENYAENDTDCPECLPQHSKVLDILRSQEQSRNLHEDFHHQLERSEDGFSVVADYLGRGLFQRLTLLAPATAAAAGPPAAELRAARS